MKVHGTEISELQLEAGVARMKATDYFRVDKIAEAMRRAGVRYDIAYQGALRLNQRERKAGRIIPVNRSGLWRHAGSSNTSTTEST
jgi:hypothetical protein